ncbi:MAG: hypothetical protein OEM61_12450, partial [Desulfobacteraceae bacterium]|nr:hypothetical protein [Desulfobacteraceae bacterium]
SGQFNINEAIAETNEMLNAIQDPAEKAARRIKLFGKQNDAAGIQLLNNTKALEDFQVSLAESGIALEQQRINNDTLQGSLKALSSAWEGIVLGFENGTGVFAGVKDILFALARNLKTIIKFVVAATGVFLSYKAGIIATNIATKLAAAGQKLFAIATGKATFSVKAFSTALKLNPIGLFVTVLGTAITAISLFGKGVDQAAVTQERYNKGLEKGNELGKEQVGILQEQIAEQFRLIGLQEEAGDLTSVEAKEAKLEVLMDNRMTAQRAIEESQKKINHLTNRYLQYTKDILTAEERKTLSFTEQAALERERRNRASETVAILTEQQKEFKKGLKEIKNQEAELTVAKKNQIDEIAEKESAALKKLAADRRKELSLYRKRLEDLQDAAIVSGFKRESQQLKRKFERDIAAIKGNSQVEIDLRKALEDALQ